MSEPSRHKRISNVVADKLDTIIIPNDTVYALQSHLELVMLEGDYEARQLTVVNILRAEKGQSPYNYNGDLIQEELNYFGGLSNGAFVGKSTQSIARLLCEFVRRGMMESVETNEILSEDTVGFKIVEREPIPYVDVIDSLDHDELIGESEKEPVIHKLMNRMELCFSNHDYPGVLHAGASLLEAIGRLHSKHERSATASFSKVMKAFKAHSPLPDSLKDEMEAIYIQRNREPNAGHGNLETESSITEKDAVTVISTCYAAVKGHYLSVA